MAAGGFVGRAFDQDVLAVGEGQARSVVVHDVSGNDCIKVIAASGCTTLSQNVSQFSSGSRLTSDAPSDRPYSIMIERLSGAWTVSASRNKSHLPAGVTQRPGRGRGSCRSSPAAGGRSKARGPEDRARRSPRDLAGPVGAAIVDDQDFEVRIGLPANRGQAFGQVELFVLGRKDRRDQRWVGCRTGESARDSLAAETIRSRAGGSARSRRSRVDPQDVIWVPVMTERSSKRSARSKSSACAAREETECEGNGPEGDDRIEPGRDQPAVGEPSGTARRRSGGPTCDQKKR